MSLFNKIKSEEFARVIEWNPAWDIGAPLPQVFSNGHKTFLIYLINNTNSETVPVSIDNSAEKNFSLALVEFNGHTFRFGIANDEVLNGLPLYSKGLKQYSAHIIENSSWIKEIKDINKVHPNYNENEWLNKKHFTLLFHDEIFEIIAIDYKIETFQATFSDLAKEVALRMNKK